MESYLGNILVAYLLLFATIGFWLCYGWSKIFNINQICCFGLSAYCYGICTTKFNLDPILCLFLGIVTGILANVLLFMLHRLNTKIDLTILSFLLVLFFYSLVINLNDFTNGPLGITSIPELSENKYIYLGIFAVCTLTVIHFFSKNYNGIISRVLYETDSLSNLSIKSKSTLLSVFIIAGAISGVGGVLSASYYSYIDPSNLHYSFIVTLLLICSAVGKNPWNILWVTALVVIGPELLRFLQISSLYFAPIRNLIFDFLLIFIIFNQSQNAAQNI
jgi:ABC-type branched-subunit amino acid transport system permease subunit